MWTALLDAMLDRQFRRGTLIVHFPDGRQSRYGDGTGPAVTVYLTTPELVPRIVKNPELAVGEGYTDGTLKVEDDDLRGFIGLAIRNIGPSGGLWWQRWLDGARRLVRAWNQFNPARRAQANVAHHYDLSAALYELFLDADKQYSCAYFTRPDLSLDDAQAAKKAHIAGKLLLEPGMSVLDIGCGWGGMALTLASDYGARVTGITLSAEQHKIATQRAEEAGLAGQVEFRLADYRSVREKFDRIVSVGMFEHVGIPHYRTYFRTVGERLTPEGIALIHTIGRIAPPDQTSPWIEKYIFPGGYVPSLSEMAAAFEKERLYQTDIEVWRLHYAETLLHWQRRFEANLDAARELYDERFCRMWRYYLAASEMTFRYGRQAVFQVQLAHDQRAVPLTREYLYPLRSEGAVRHAAE
ncbi:MAG: cyclopropane-fatty-acyl-phospholipid synthase family protein [Pseudomonadota bacterium]